MNQQTKTTLWMVFLVLASVALSIQFACAMPFAALAVIAVLSLHTRAAFGLVLGAWVANQAIGYGVLGYPMEASSFMWGGIIGLSAVVGLLVCMLAKSKLGSYSFAFQTALLFVAAFAGYQGAMFGAALILGDTANFTIAINGQVFAVNLFALIGLLAAHRVSQRFGVLPSHSKTTSPS